MLKPTDQTHLRPVLELFINWPCPRPVGGSLSIWHLIMLALARLIIICLCAIFDQVLRLGFYFSVCLSLLCIAQFLQPGISDLTNCARNWCILSSIMQSRYRNGEYICPGRGNREVISTVSSIAVNKIRKETLPKAQRTRGPRLSSFNKLIALK